MSSLGDYFHTNDDDKQKDDFGDGDNGDDGDDCDDGDDGDVDLLPIGAPGQAKLLPGVAASLESSHHPCL